MDPKLLQQIEDYLKASGIAADKLRERMDAVKNSAVEFNRELLNAQRHYKEINSDFNDLSQQFKNVLDDLRGWNSTSGLINKSFKTLGGLADKLKYDAQEISKLSLKDLESLEKKSRAEISNLKARKEELDQLGYKQHTEEELRALAKLAGSERNKQLAKEAAQYLELKEIFDDNNELREDENNYVRTLLSLLLKRKREEKEIRDNLGLTGQAFKSISKTLSDFGFSNDIIEEMGDELEKAAKKGKVGFKELFPIIKEGLTKALQDPLTQFAVGLALIKSGINDIKRAFNAFTEIDSTVTETSRTLGMTNDQVYEMNRAAKEVGSTQNNTLFTTKQISQAISEINSQLGLSVDLGADTNAEFAAMTNQMGLSGQEAANIYKLGTLSNLSLKDTNKAISAQIIATQKSTGIQLNAKQIYQEIGKLNAGITAKFQQNPTLIAKAVAQAKALGTTLEQIDKVGESLLNFETSIENELKAELITGRQLNLERARAAALTGDQVTLMQEVASQVGTLEDFNKMNILAQKSLAEAFGMTRQDMAEMLQQQEIFNKLGDVSGKSAAEQLKIARERGLSEEDSLVVQLKQQAAAEKLAAAFDTIKLAVADLLTGPFSIFVDMMSFLSKNAWAAYAAVGAMAGISVVKLIAGVVSLAASLGAAGVSAATVNAALTFGVGLVAVLAAVGLFIGGIKSLTKDVQSQAVQQAKDGIAPASKGPFTITDKFGAIAVTAEGDNLLASPNINRKNNTENTSLAPPKEYSINVPSNNTINRQDTTMLTNLIAKFENTMTKLIDSNNQLPKLIESRPIQVNWKVDGKEMGTVLVQGSSKAV